jgi:hypothetical protein
MRVIQGKRRKWKHYQYKERSLLLSDHFFIAKWFGLKDGGLLYIPVLFGSVEQLDKVYLKLGWFML